MNLGIRSIVVMAGLIAAHGMLAQAPSGAPSGSNGMCKDGSYSTAATKDGACRGHKGVQSWYGAMTAKAAKPSAMTPSSKSASPAPVSAAAKPAAQATAAPAVQPAAPRAAQAAAAPAAQPTSPMPSAPPAQNTPTMARASYPRAPVSGSEAAQMPATTGGGNGSVWVNSATKVYHCQGTRYYGKTKAGTYMSEADAKANGARPDAGKPCTR